MSARAARTVRPISIALLAVCRTVASLTSRPLCGALQVAAAEPTTAQTRRVIRSIHDQSSASTNNTRLRRMSTKVQG